MNIIGVIESRIGSVLNSRYRQMLVLVVVTAIASTVKFGHIRPDSVKYLQLVDYILGISASLPKSPFSHRFILPLLTAVLSCIFGDPVIIFSIISMVLVIGTTIVMYHIVELYSSSLQAFYAAIIGAVSLPVMLYGASPLVESGAMFIIGLLVYISERREHEELLYVLMPLGVCVKETVLFLAIYLLFKWRLRAVLPITLSAAIHGALRVVQSGGIGHLWLFTLFNVVDNIPFMAFMLVGSLAIPGLLLVLRWRQGGITRENPAFDLFVIGTISFLPLFLMGMFFAYFDARFVWPFYYTILPVCFASIGSTE